MKYLFYFAIAAIGLYMFGCDDSRKYENYDKGYEAAWEEDDEPSSWASKEEKEGYENGLDDAWAYNTGYDDGYDDKRPKYFNDPLYMDGYKDGKKDRR